MCQAHDYVHVRLSYLAEHVEEFFGREVVTCGIPKLYGWSPEQSGVYFLECPDIERFGLWIVAHSAPTFNVPQVVVGTVCFGVMGCYIEAEASSFPLPSPVRSDLNFDNVVNIIDLATFGLAFGSYPTHSRWNALADLDGNSAINIADGVLIAKDFGKTVPDLR